MSDETGQRGRPMCGSARRSPQRRKGGRAVRGERGQRREKSPPLDGRARSARLGRIPLRSVLALAPLSLGARVRGPRGLRYRVASGARPPHVRATRYSGHSCGSSPEPPGALLKRSDRAEKVDSAELWPVHIGEVELAVSALPQQEAGQTNLPTCADDEVRVRQPYRVEVVVDRQRRDRFNDCL